MSFKENLRYYREQAGYTAKEFSKLLDLPYTTYAGYENNQERKPRFENLVKMADILNVSLDDLVGRTPKNEDEQLKKDIEQVISSINENNGPFTMQLLRVDKNYIRLAFENDDLVSEGINEARGIGISKSDIIEAINLINLQTDNTRRILLFEKLAALTLDKAQYHCESTSSALNEVIKNWSDKNIIDGVTGKLLSTAKIKIELENITQRLEHFKQEQEQIFKYRKSLQNFMAKNK